MSDPGASADDDDRRELYEQLLQLMRTRVQDINSRLQALSAEIDSAGFEGRGGTPDGAVPATTERIVAQFAAHDAEGNEYDVHVVRRFHSLAEHSDGGTNASDILVELRTSDGRPVQRLEHATYQIVDGSAATDIWSSDPKAL